MSFSKADLELIKSKIQISTEIEKKTKVIKKGRDFWCCCPFHEEKTPSCKINDDLGSFYCFGCGAKGDIFTLYTDLYNFSFPDAVKELAQKVGVRPSNENFKYYEKNENVFRILEDTTKWFENNLKTNAQCQEYLNKRMISKQTIEKFRIGYSFNPNQTLYNYLKELKYEDKDLIESNVIKVDQNKKTKDFFYKRLMFPIFNQYNKILGFGGRVLDNKNPKYINSPESDFFKKRNILYNLNNAKQNIRSKNNMLICEGYMDVVSLHENKIQTAVAPLGTALTEDQLLLSWKYVKKPTIMFDGDSSGLRASYKTALMSLQFLSSDRFLQFIKLPKDLDPDSYIKKYSVSNLIKILKKPIPLVEFIFDQSSETIDLKNTDNKIIFDKYIDDIINTIKDNKIKYFYKNEFKNLFFNKLKSSNQRTKKKYNFPKVSQLKEKQIYSFLITYINHPKIKSDLYKVFKESELLNESEVNFIEYFNKRDLEQIKIEDLLNSNHPPEISNILQKSIKNSIFQLFPYSSPGYSSYKALEEVKESIKNLNTRLSNLKKINKSLNELDNNLSSMSWEELKKINLDLQFNEDTND